MKSSSTMGEGQYYTEEGINAAENREGYWDTLHNQLANEIERRGLEFLED